MKRVASRKIKTFGIENLFSNIRERVIQGSLQVYDITSKDLNTKSKKQYHSHRYCGHSVVFSYNNRNKILVFNS